MDLLAIIIVVIALYWRTMDYYYLIDDIVRRWGYLLVIPETAPPPEFFAIKPPKVKHLFLTLTHCVNVSLIYFLWGWEAAAVFAFHPLAASCTAWITGGYYQVTAFFTLTAYYFITQMPGLIGAIIGSIFFTAALGSTVNCIAFPFLFLFFQPAWGLSLFWPLTFFLFGHRFQYGFKKRNAGKGDKITIRKAVLVPKVLAYYIKDVVFPYKLAFFREFGFEYGKDPDVKKDLESINPEFFKSIGIIAAFCAFGFFFSPVGTMIFMLGILPFTQWKVLGQFVAERYMYVPLIGWAVILSSALSSPYALPIFSVILALYIYRSHKHIQSFKNIETLYENGIEQFPNCISNYVNLAERKLHTGKAYEAYKLLKRGLEIDPKSFLCHANLAAYWLGINEMEMGEYHTRKALQYSENRGMAYNVFSNQLKRIGENNKMREEGKKNMEKMLEEIRKTQNILKQKLDEMTEEACSKQL